jgi:hypothetical protein
MRLSVHQRIAFKKCCAEPQHAATVARPSWLQHLPLHLRKKNLTRLLTQRPDGIFDSPYEVGEFSLAVRCEKRGEEERIRQPQFSRGGNRLQRVFRVCDGLKLR